MLTQTVIFLLVRGAGDPLSLAAPVRRQIAALNPTQTVFNLQTMEQVVAQSIVRQRFSMLLLGVFAGVALLLASVGLYGLMSQTVTARQRELGIRLALGAQSRDALRLVIGQGMKLVLLGAGLGLLGALALTRQLKTLLFGVSATDLGTFALVTLLLLLVALLACWIPARRATRVDPLIALRCE
jgi:ABC-type antimicrobial peptide transport system permease subunit